MSETGIIWLHRTTYIVLAAVVIILLYMYFVFSDMYLEMQGRLFESRSESFPAAVSTADANQWLNSDEPVIFSVLQIKPKCKIAYYLVLIIVLFYICSIYTIKEAL